MQATIQAASPAPRASTANTLAAFKVVPTGAAVGAEIHGMDLSLPIPDDVQEACAQWVAQLFWQTKRDPGLAHESISGGVARAALGTLPATVKTMLAPYRNWRL